MPGDRLSGSLGDVRRYQKAINDRAEREMISIPGWPDVPKPTSNIDPPVYGDSELAKLTRYFMNLNPILRDKVSSIQQGPNDDVISNLIRSKMSPYDFDRSNLLGQYDLRDKSIAVNPRIGVHDNSFTRSEILGHELGHAAGYGEREAQELEEYVPLPSRQQRTYNRIKR
jgi:hypothetical protein